VGGAEESEGGVGEEVGGGGGGEEGEEGGRWAVDSWWMILGVFGGLDSGLLRIRWMGFVLEA